MPSQTLPSLAARTDANVIIRQTLLDGNRGDGEVAKAVEAIIGGDPNIAFTILKETVDEIA